jgi:O-antigen/teichoic acid export membrane protein
MGERIHRSVMNIKVGMFFYILSLLIAFFSRKIFLDCLGAEFIGLTGMLMNIMSFLSVAELGIGTSIIYFLYKPLQENNHQKINDVVSMLAYLYRNIGMIIGIGGIVISLFFPFWFNNLSIHLPLVYFAFYSFLATSIAEYIFNYKQILVTANQKQYLVSAYFQTISIVQSVTQILLAYYYRNLYLWVIVGLVFTIIGIIVFNHRIGQLYPWLVVDLKKGRQNLKRYPEVLKKTRQIFIQRIKDFILYHSDDIFVGIFVSVIQVAYFGNYTMIINKFNFFVNILSVGIGDGVGNLLAEGDENNIMKVYWELTATRFLILGAVIFTLIMFFQSFIGCWLGTKYQLDETIVYLLIFNLFIRLQNAAVYSYIGASGLFSDVWTAWAELALNLSLLILLGPRYGIIGILIAKAAGFFLISAFWKPYYLFTQGLHKSVWIFWKGMIPYYTIFAIFVIISLCAKYTIVNTYVTTLFSLVIIAISLIVPILGVYFILLFKFTKGMESFVARNSTAYRILKYVTP